MRLTDAVLFLVLCEYSKFRIESNGYFSIRFDLKRAQLFEIFEYLPSPISYLFNRMMPIFHLSNQQNQQTGSRLLQRQNPCQITVPGVRA